MIPFPIKLAFTCTAHKIQRATIEKPMKLIIYVMDIWMAAITYVMLSRICSLSQLYILEEFDETKMYPSQIAMEELERLKQISQNNNLTDWEREDDEILKIYSLNCRSLQKHYLDVISDDIMMKSDIICLQETWLEDDMSTEEFAIPNYELKLNSNGKGKGIATYFKKEIWTHEADVKMENMQLSKFSSNLLQLVVLYRSQDGNHEVLTEILQTLVVRNKPTLVIGDLNYCYLESSSNLTKQYFHNNLFSQIVEEPTHIEGNLIDQANVRDVKEINNYSTEIHSKYYTDHKGIAVLIKRLVYIKLSNIEINK